MYYELEEDAYWTEDDVDYAEGSAAQAMLARGCIRLPPLRVGRIDGMIFIALALALFMGLHIMSDLYNGKAQEIYVADVPLDSPEQASAVSASLAADTGISVPYDRYVLTQGPHGFSYGHMAIDIAAGKGAVIMSPITGEVTHKYIDGVGNTVLVIENAQYEVMLLHGIYNVNIGKQVSIGDPIGTESNIGYTTDMQGRLCTNRDCGYHTHLNIVDKASGQNLDPLQVLNIDGGGTGGSSGGADQ